MRIFYLAISLLCALCAAPSYAKAESIPEDKHAAVILAYHRIGEENYPSSNLRIEDFKAHLSEIEYGDYNVMALPDIMTALKEKRTLPEKTIAITFEGGYQSAYKNAMPLLIEKQIPFTVFYSASNIGADFEQYISWRDIRYLARHERVSFGILPDIYARIRDFSDAENKRLFNNAVLAYRKNFRKEPKLFSYPFGEYTLEYKEWIATQGLDAAFGLQSGVAYADMDFFNVPRFTMTEGFGDIERFRTVASALPIPAYDIEPEQHILTTPEPLFGFSVPEHEIMLLKDIQCFISGQGSANISAIGTNRIEIRPPMPLEDERVRINCTLNSGTKEMPQWRWFGMHYSLDIEAEIDEEDISVDPAASESSENESHAGIDNTAINNPPDELPRPQE